MGENGALYDVDYLASQQSVAPLLLEIASKSYNTYRPYYKTFKQDYCSYNRKYLDSVLWVQFLHTGLSLKNTSVTYVRIDLIVLQGVSTVRLIFRTHGLRRLFKLKKI